MTVQGEAIAGTILQQTFIVEYVVNHQMCDECRRVEAKDLWSAMVMDFILFGRLYVGNCLVSYRSK